MNTNKHLRFAVLGISVFLLLVVAVPSSQAHSSVLTSNPSSGAVVSVMPDTVAIEFDEDLIVIGSAKTNVIQITDEAGVRIDDGVATTSGATLTVGIKDLSSEGVVNVAWRVVSSDGHPAEGTYQFSVSAGASTGTSPEVVSPAVTPDKKDNFLVRHREHIYLVLGALIFIGIWAEFDRRRKLLD
ncbi:unannotated protein [freshwater metagenome]|uniref:Unannotated protein n=1 Tax=freshwater metagenome TaxID=449393 RepID=A0A6J7A7F0_9ZZZZ